jgi:glutamyl-tRNA synthetase
LAAAFKPILKEKGYEKDDAFMNEFCKLVKEKVQFVHEFWDHGKYIFEAPTAYDEKVMTKKWNDKSKDQFKLVLHKFTMVDNWQTQNIHDAFEDLSKEIGKIDMQLLRVLITGVAGGPQLFDMLALMGKEEVLRRLTVALDKF